MRFRDSLQTKFLFVVGLGIVPALFVLVLFGQGFESRSMDMARELLIIKAERFSKFQQTRIDETRLLLTTLAQDPILQAHENPHCETHLAEILRNLPNPVANLLVMDPEGKVLCNAVSPGKHHSLADRLYYQKAMRTGAFAVGEFAVGRTTQTQIIGMAYPLVRDGKVVMLTATSLNLDTMTDLPRTELLGHRVERLIVDHHGHVLLHQDDNGFSVTPGEDVSKTPLGQSVLSRAAGDVIEVPDLSGRPSLFAFAPLGPAAAPYAHVAIGVDMHALANEQERLLYMQVGASFVALLLGLWLASHSYTRLLKRRLDPLIEAVRHIEQGEQHPDIPSDATGDELGRLSRALSGMNQELHERHQALFYQARHDQLTGLPNRADLDERLGQAIDHAREEGTLLAVMFLDIDHFKTINNSLGHAFGDQLLCIIAQRILRLLGREGSLARMGGDEFAILLERVEGETAVGVFAERLQKTLGEPFELDGHTLFLTASMGIAIYPRDADDVVTFLQNADAALFQSKKAGRNTYRFFTPALVEEARERLTLVNALRHALDLSETGEAALQQLSLHYQPQFQLNDGRLVSAEALARWHHPELGPISPARFIPVAEQGGLIIRLGQWALRSALQQMRQWLDEGRDIAYVAVNVSALQLRGGKLPEEVAVLLQHTGLEAHHLELEITESAILDDPDLMIGQLQDLHALGVRLALDDFGTGYSSLTYLKRLPLHRVKIDQSFVRDMLVDAHDEAITRAILVLGHSLGLEVVAEGVECAEQANHLLRLGCNSAQGYHLGRPVPAPQLFG